MKARFQIPFGSLQHLGARVEDGAGVGLLLGLTRHHIQEQEAADIGDRQCVPQFLDPVPPPLTCYVILGQELLLSET